MRYHNGVDVLPWFAPEKSDQLEHGTRLYSYRDYHTAPQGTRARLGRRNGIGQLLVKHSGGSWRPEGGDGVGLTAYGLENRPSYVEREG